MAWSCATRDDANKDNVCTPTILAGINRPPPSRPSRIYPVVRDYEPAKRCMTPSRTRDPASKCLSIYGGKAGLGVPQKAKRHRWEDSARDGTWRRSDPTNETIRAGAEDAEYRNGSDTKEGERLLLRTRV